jgi:hypothetical protein
MGIRAFSAVLAALPLLAQPKWNPDLIISPAGLSYNQKAMAVSPKDYAVWILAARLNGSTELAELWRVDPQAQSRQVVAFPVAPKIDRFENVLATNQAGDVFALGWAGKRMHLVKADATARVSWLRPIGLDYVHPLGLVAGPRGEFLMFGDGGAGAFAARIDETGRVLWVKNVNKEPLAAIFTSGALLEDGAAVLAGNIWDFKQGNIGMGLGETMLVRLDGKGNIVRQKTFPGRVAAAARTKDGNIALVDDPQAYAGSTKLSAVIFQGDAAQNSYMRLQAWTPELAPLWTAKLTEFPVQFLPMQVAPAPDGGVILLGTERSFTLITSQYDAAGRQIWTVADPNRRWSVSLLAPRGDAFTIAHQVFETDIRVGLSEFKLK